MVRAATFVHHLREVVLSRLRESSLAVLLGVALLTAESRVSAQKRAVTIGGFVADTAGTPLDGAEILVLGTAHITRANESGTFRLSELPAGHQLIRVRRFGYRPATFGVTLVESDTLGFAFVLEPIAVTLTPVIVEALERRYASRMTGFAQRYHGGLGAFITRREIEKRNPQQLSDMLRMVPGVRLLTTPSGRPRVEMQRAPKGCEPNFWLDGTPYPNNSLSIDAFPPSIVEAVEIYRGAAEVPPAFRSMNTPCGVIAIWTRPGGDPSADQKR